MALVGIGPVAFGPYDHGNPSFSWGADVSPSGLQPASIGGLMPWAKAKTLRELAANFGAATTIGGVTGVLVDIEFSGALWDGLTGPYLMTDFRDDITKAATMDPDGCPFTLAAFFIGVMA